jgi:hypothetical protein
MADLLAETLDLISVEELVYVSGQCRQKSARLGGRPWGKIWAAIGLEVEEALIRRAANG